ncbi:MAG: MotA/TolQ/ExbB proton channel family protein [Acidobacteriota bacterium]
MIPGLAGLDVAEALAASGLAARLTLFVLLVMSIATWATWITAWWRLKRRVTSVRQGRRSFRDAGDTARFAGACETDPDAPVSRLFFSFHDEYEALVRRGGGRLGGSLASQEAARQLLGRRVGDARNRQVEQARGGLTLLAVVGSTAPFVGLFGTVWGVMDALSALGLEGSAELAVIAPGIAEALIATAAGLVAAIPAVWGHAVLLGSLRELRTELDSFASELLDVYDRSVAIESAGEGSAS